MLSSDFELLIEDVPRDLDQLHPVEQWPGDRLEPMLEVACPNILFPYLREAVSDLVSHGGFPQLLLSPVNFEAMYLQKKRPPAEQDDSQAATH